jgi:hypothetical protein
VYHEQFLVLVASKITRLNEIKQAKLASLTLEVKDDIKRLWEKCFYGDQEKNECALFNEPCSNTDENYKNLSQYANTLNELYERNKSIFETAEIGKQRGKSISTSRKNTLIRIDLN